MARDGVRAGGDGGGTGGEARGDGELTMARCKHKNGTLHELLEVSLFYEVEDGEIVYSDVSSSPSSRLGYVFTCSDCGKVMHFGPFRKYPKFVQRIIDQIEEA